MIAPGLLTVALLCALAASDPPDRDVPADAVAIEGASELFGEPPPADPPEPQGPGADGVDGLRLGSRAAVRLRPPRSRRPIDVRPPASPSDQRLDPEVERASRALAEGRYGAARDRLARYLQARPDAPDADLARGYLELAEHHLATARAEAIRRRPDRERARREEKLFARRVEVVAGATLFSGWLGFGGARVAGFDEGAIGLSLVAAGIGGLTSAIALDEVELERGDASLVSASIAFSTLNGLALAGVAGSDTPEDWYANTMLVGVGGVGGAALALGPFDLHPDAGQVGLATSFGTWAAFLGGMGALAFDPAMEREELLLLLALSADAGLVAGAMLSIETLRISRYRAVMVDLGGGLGVGLVGVALAIRGGESDDALLATLLTGGAATGIGVAWFATDGDDRESEPERAGPVARLAPALLPGVGGPALGLQLDLSPF